MPDDMSETPTVLRGETGAVKARKSFGKLTGLQLATDSLGGQMPIANRDADKAG